MNFGTISEKRNENNTTTTTASTTTAIPPKVDTTVLKVVENTAPSKEPVLMVENPPSPTEVPNTAKGEGEKCKLCGSKEKCKLCGLEKGVKIAIKGSIVLVLLALCFNLIKTAK